MGSGTLKVEARAAQGLLPIENARVTVYTTDDVLVYETFSDMNGNTDIIELPAPDRGLSLISGTEIEYSTYVVSVMKQAFIETVVRGVQIFDGQMSILPVNMIPQESGIEGPSGPLIFDIGPHILEGNPRAPGTGSPNPPGTNMQGFKTYKALRQFKKLETNEPNARMLKEVVIPDYVVVHLGPPDEPARNIQVSFSDYIKNVASSVVYPTWPESALEANIYAQISFILNRLYNEWYPSRGYPFDVTSTEEYDQKFEEGRNIYGNVSLIVDRIFNQYIKRAGRKEPFLATYCNGDSEDCDGMSLWESLDLAKRGFNSYQILRYFYPPDIGIVTSDLFESFYILYPGTPLRLGSRGDDVELIQRYLNEISINFPFIPKIENPNGIFDETTEMAVRTFQQIFSLDVDGIVGVETWYNLTRVYAAMRNLFALSVIGSMAVGDTPPDVILRQGDTGDDVRTLQYMIDYLSFFIPEVLSVEPDGLFGPKTAESVRSFQSYTGVPADGVVGPETWQRLYNTYWRIKDTISLSPSELPSPELTPFPGYLMGYGSRGEHVEFIQEHLNRIGDRYRIVQKLNVDGLFGDATEAAVVAFQKQFDLNPDGIVGPITWNKIIEIYDEVTSEESGAPEALYINEIKNEQRTEEIEVLQRKLNTIASHYLFHKPIKATGIYNPSTSKLVEAFQKFKYLPPTGIVDSATIYSINNEYESIINRKQMANKIGITLLRRYFIR